MENVAHTLVGAALAKAGLEKKTALATPTLLIAANLPDIDILGSLFGQNYLDFHRGITHALVGTVVLAAALGAAVWGIHRIVMRDPARRARFRPLFQVAVIGILTHPLLDYLNDYGIRPWLPFSDRRHYGDLLSIVDPWLWIIFGIALYMLTVSRLGRMAWMALGGLMGILIFLAAGARPGVLWLFGVALGLVAGYFLRRHGYQPARAALLIFVAYLAGIAIVHWSVLRSAVAMAPGLSNEPVLSVSALPGRPDTAHQWTIVVETTTRYFIADVRDLEAHSRPDFEVFEKNLDDSCFQASLTDGQMAALARFARFPSVTSRVSNGTCTTFLRDLRYARRALSGWGVASTTVPVRATNPTN